MNRPLSLLNHVASAPSGIDAMMCDDDSTSRDSGFSEPMDENTPVCFKSLSEGLEHIHVGEVAEESTIRSPSRQQKKCQKVLKSSSSRRLFPLTSSEALAIRNTNLPEQPSRKRSIIMSDDEKRQNHKKSVSAFAYVQKCQEIKSKESSYAESEEGTDEADVNRMEGDYVENAKTSSMLDDILGCIRHQQLQPVYSSLPSLPSASASADAYVQKCQEIKSKESSYAESSPSASSEASSSEACSSASGSASRSFALPKVKAKRKLKTSQTTPNVENVEEEEEVDNAHPTVKYHLETLNEKCFTSYRLIGRKTLIGLINNMTDEEFNKKYILIDCRYPFEYEAGHIKHAINCYDTEEVGKHFYQGEGKKEAFHERVPIFYCEFSQKRGPKMASALRALDRAQNDYPKCHFAELYVLYQGYRKFHQFVEAEGISDLCHPNNYVEMNDNRFSTELKKYTQHKKKKNLPTRRVSSRKLSEDQKDGEKATTSKERDGSVAGTSDDAEARSLNANNRTPQVPRTSYSRRNLFTIAQESPTNFDRQKLPSRNDGLKTPSPAKPSSFPLL
ncbi:hypothetical protein L3Y34_007374 [Caenorhabditis briggsae]|uniref:protein-tyrosine-phosphatase n=3 Tax=Caenorhabditis briggsae TaxID=6238 RepID=A0AAE9A3T3_CAEBR|nr:hypothetical protein L3Y34_007374 [Caenorhabditis briggsae]